MEDRYVIERLMAKMLWERQRKVTSQIISARRDFGIKRVDLAVGIYNPFGEHGDPELFTDDANVFGDKIDDAKDDGRITPKQCYDLYGAGVVMSGIGEADGKPLHVAVVVSIAICASELRRAAYLGSILSAVTGERSIGAAIGDSIAPSGRQLAERLGVAVSLLRPP